MMNDRFPYGPWRGLGGLNLDLSLRGPHQQASQDLDTISEHIGAIQQSQRHRQANPTLPGGQYHNEVLWLAAWIGYAILTSGRGFM
jgi:hypothetical protein